MSGLQPLTKTLLNSSLNRTLGALHPLTKTLSNNSLKQYGLKRTTLNTSGKGVPYLSKANLDQSIKSNKSNSSLRGMSASAVGGLKTSSKRGRAILKLNEDTADQEYEEISEDSEEDEAGQENFGALSNTDLQRQYQPTEDVQNDQVNVEGEIRSSQEPDNGIKSSTLTRLNQGDPPVKPVSKLPENLEKQQELERTASKTSFTGNGSSSDDLISKNFYGGSMLLSQSTGLTRKINTSNEPIGYVSEESDLVKNPPEGMSGIVFNTRNDDQRRKELQGTRTPATAAGSYQPNQTIFSNLQRTNTQFLSDMKLQSNSQSKESDIGSQLQQLGEAANNRDFSRFLNTGSGGNHNQNHDTRTQQRLWLQRENSLMDIGTNIDPSKLSNFSNLSLNKLMFAHNYNASMTNVREGAAGINSQANLTPGSDNGTPRDSNLAAFGDNSSVTNLLYLVQSGHQNSIQSRVEFERLNREYINVRRHVNPVAESLNRVEAYVTASKGLDVQKKQGKKGNSGQTRSANSFKEFAPRWEEKQGEVANSIGRLWLEALLTSSSSTASLQLYKQEQQNIQNQQQQQIQNLQNQQQYQQDGPHSQHLQNSNANLAYQKQQLYHQQLQQQQQLQHDQLQHRGYRRNLSTTPSRSMGPTTRAVKMAAQAAAASTPQGQR